MHLESNMANTPIAAEFKLTRTEAESALWRARLKPYLEAELATLREKNDSTGNDIKDTTLIRGEIRQLKRILALADEAGQEARQDEPQGPESAYPASLAD